MTDANIIVAPPTEQCKNLNESPYVCWWAWLTDEEKSYLIKSCKVGQGFIKKQWDELPHEIRKKISAFHTNYLRRYQSGNASSESKQIGKVA